MKRLLLILAPTGALAAPYGRPVPQAQSATAELWFALAALALVIALYAVHRMVNRR